MCDNNRVDASFRNKYVSVKPKTTGNATDSERTKHDTKAACLTKQIIELCEVSINNRASCDPAMALINMTGGNLPPEIGRNVCIGKNIVINDSNYNS